MSADSGVGSYDGALTAAVKATDNFHVETPVAGNLEITQRMLGITLDDVTMAYSTGEIDVTYRITSGSLYGDDKQPVLVNYDITVGGNVVDLDRLAVQEGGYVLNVQGEDFDNSNYGIASVAAGTLTVTPYEITSVTWKAPGQLVYKGAAFESGELYTVENFENGNGDVVTFSVSYGGEVKNAGKGGLPEGVDPELAEAVKRADIAILDPPRAGCRPELLQAVAEVGVGRIVYVSCDPATLARDIKLLGEMGYEFVEATPVDMFPHTGHVETVVLLSKLKTDKYIEVELEVEEFERN